MITTLSLTNDTLTVILDNGAKIVPVRSDNPKWTEILEVYKQFDFTAEGKIVGPEDKLLSLLSLKAVVESYSVGQLSVNSTGVTYRGLPMHTVDSNRVLAFLRDGLPFKPLANYMSRKMANPSARAINELYNFLEHKNMPITPEGKIIAYKGVQNDFYSVRGNKATVVVQGQVNGEGQILNAIGAIIEVERSSVDDDFRQGCSFGLHAGSLQYASGWGPRVVLVEIDPADVVSVPEDCGCQKLRCCKYKVIGEYTGPMPEAFTDEFNSDNDEECSVCGNYGSDCDCAREESCDNETPEDECNCQQLSCPDCFPDAAKTETPEETGCGCHCDCSASEPNLTDAKAALAQRCREIIAEDLLLDPVNLSNEKLFSELELDELDEVELAMLLETEFGTHLDDDTLETIFKTKTVSDLVDYIYSQLNPTTTTVVETVTAETDPSEGYYEGWHAGYNDRIQGNIPQYLAGDQAGADSDRHANYIDGYVVGYNS
jgi:acyl carrier protein